jgi:hypothetical protein
VNPFVDLKSDNGQKMGHLERLFDLFCITSPWFLPLVNVTLEVQWSFLPLARYPRQ